MFLYHIVQLQSDINALQLNTATKLTNSPCHNENLLSLCSHIKESSVMALILKTDK